MSNQLELKKQLIDQSAHLFGAIVIVGPLIISPSIFSSLWAGFGIGIVRELSQNNKQVTWDGIKKIVTPGSLLDIFFWTMGAGLFYIVSQ